MIVIRTPRHKLGFLFVLSLVMVAGSAWLAFGLPAWFFFPGIVGWVGILFFGFAGGWILSRLFSHRIALILDRNGLLDNSSAIPAGRIPWGEISRVGITTASEQRFLGIDVRDRALLPSSKSEFRRSIDDANAGITGFPVNIPSTTIDRTLEELQETILKYWKDPKARTELGVHDPESRGV